MGRGAHARGRPSILEYLRETAAEDGTVEKIRFGRKVVAAAFSSDDAT